MNEDRIKRIHDKLQQVLKQYAAVVRENESLKESLQTATAQAQQLQAAAGQLQQQVEILRYTNGEMSADDKKQFEKRINGYLKEIDRCIAMLGE